MKITITNELGKCEKRSATVKAWKQNPGNFDRAVHAAHYYAKKQKQNMVVVKGNSYMQTVHHIVTESDSLQKYAGPIAEANVGIVTPDGVVFQAVAS